MMTYLKVKSRKFFEKVGFLMDQMSSTINHGLNFSICLLMIIGCSIFLKYSFFSNLITEEGSTRTEIWKVADTLLINSHSFSLKIEP